MDSYFPRARSVEAVDAGAAAPEASSDKPKVTALVKTPEGYWGETDFAALARQVAKFDEATDKKGPLTLAVAVERGGNVSGVEVGATRMVVVGTSNFLINRYALEAANADIFINAVNWMMQRQEAALGISAKTPEEFRFTIAGNRFIYLGLSLLVGIPGIVTVAGLFVWLRRRR